MQQHIQMLFLITQQSKLLIKDRTSSCLEIARKAFPYRSLVFLFQLVLVFIVCSSIVTLVNHVVVIFGIFLLFVSSALSIWCLIYKTYIFSLSSVIIQIMFSCVVWHNSLIKYNTLFFDGASTFNFLNLFYLMVYYDNKNE